MIYQIDQDSKAKSSAGGKQPKSEENKKSENSAPLDKKASKVLNEYFDDIFNQLTIEHNLKETAFRHTVDSNKRIVS